jgi:hypothetical protein
MPVRGDSVGARRDTPSFTQRHYWSLTVAVFSRIEFHQFVS